MPRLSSREDRTLLASLQTGVVPQTPAPEMTLEVVPPQLPGRRAALVDRSVRPDALGHVRAPGPSLAHAVQRSVLRRLAPLRERVDDVAAGDVSMRASVTTSQELRRFTHLSIRTENFCAAPAVALSQWTTTRPRLPTTRSRSRPSRCPSAHADEPAPPVQEGMRPEAAANPIARPEQDEESGPLGGLVAASAAQASAEAKPNPDPATDADAALLASMGVEEEGIESGQMLGLVASVIVAIVSLVVILIFLFYLPFRQQVDETASNIGQYPELEQVQTDGLLKTQQYALVDSVYRVPVDNAMSLVTARYRQGRTAPAGLPVDASGVEHADGQPRPGHDGPDASRRAGAGVGREPAPCRSRPRVRPGRAPA